jgi:hypothetical protein
MTARVFRHLPDEGKGALRASLIGALKSDIGVAPFAFEIRTAAHLMAMGGDVQFHDLCGGGGYDFLVSRGRIEMEVECKSFSADLGRPIYLLRQYQLGYYLQPAMQLRHKEGSIQLLVATLTDRLHTQREFMEAVATRIREALENGTSIESGSPCSVSYHRFPISGSPFDCGTPVRIDEQEVVDHCNKASGENIGHVLIVFQPKRYAIVIGLQSRQPNRPLKTIERTLRDAAARQLSAKRPGIICVQFRNMTNNELKELANAPRASGEPSGLQIMTTHFLRRESRDHIHTVAYVAPGNFVERRSVKRDFLTADFIRSTDISEDAASYTFTNPRNPMATDARYAFF